MACGGHGPNEACNCTFVAGDNITIVGTGPYIVYREPAANLVTADTVTVDLTQEGLGTDDSPRVVSGTVAIAGLLEFDAALLDVEITGSGTALSPTVVSAWLACLLCDDPLVADGLVPVTGRDGDYHPRVIPTIPAGALTAGVGLSGDGSAGDPLRVDLCSYDELIAACGTP